MNDHSRATSQVGVEILVGQPVRLHDPPHRFESAGLKPPGITLRIQALAQPSQLGRVLH
jgi:hypothetical protein